jgi:3-phenylpropionate/trans-cinnamate dioxygenase ferredoxin subunit
MRSVATLADLVPGTAVKVEVDGVPVCLVRLGEDEVRAIHDVCSHREWSLSDGLVFGRTVECSLHGSTFDLDTGAPTTLPANRPVPTFAAEIVDGEVRVDVSVATNGAEPTAH